MTPQYCCRDSMQPLDVVYSCVETADTCCMLLMSCLLKSLPSFNDVGSAAAVQQNMLLLQPGRLCQVCTCCICRWGLQALYISWLIPASGPQAPATATFLSGLGFCGLEPSLMQALTGRSSDGNAGALKGVSCGH